MPMKKKYSDKHVLVVDDNSTLVELMTDKLRDELGCKATGFGESTKALAFIKSGNKPDAVILDRRLNWESGVTLAIRLREKLGKDALILMQSGLVDLEEIGYSVSNEKPDAYYQAKPTGLPHLEGADRKRFDKMAREGEMSVKRRRKHPSVDAIFERNEDKKIIEVLEDYFSGKGKPPCDQIEPARGRS